MTTSSQTQPPPLPRRSESGLHTRAVNAAAGVLLAAMQQGTTTPTGLALAPDSARLLNSPEHAAQFQQLEARVAELARPAIEAKRTEIRESLIALAAQAEADRDFEGAFNVQCRLREHEELWKREDEEQRPADGLAPATCGRALSTGQPCPDHPAQAETPALTVYQAWHGPNPLGLYTTAAAARAHCEAEERRAWAKFEDPTFDWIEDGEDGIAEMTVRVDDEDCETGHVVIALTVASAYTEEAGQ